MCAHLMRLLLQMVLLVVLILFYRFFYQVPIAFNAWLLAAPFAVLLIGLTGLSAGLLFAVLTAKYRDLTNVAILGIRLMMFVTPVIYSVSIIPAKVRWLAELNPLTPLFELCRYSVLREGTFTAAQLVYSVTMTTILFVVAMIFFNKQGDKIMDVV
jgi:lipopolysaccharide transport system permease protein